MNKIIHIIVLLSILSICYFIKNKYRIIENFNEFQLTDDEIFNASLDTLIKHLSLMQKNFYILNKEQKVVYDKILKRLDEEKKNLTNEFKLLLEEIKKSNPLNSFDGPAYYKTCKDVDINIESIVKLKDSSQKDLTMTCASICKDNSKCLSFEYDNINKQCRFSKSCHKDSNFVGGKKMGNIIYTKKGGKSPPELNYDIHLNKKMLNVKRFKSDLNVPCINNKVGPIIQNCNREKASKTCDKTPGCISWELHKPTKNCTLYSECHKPMVTSNNFTISNPPKKNRSPDSNAWGNNTISRTHHNRGELNSPRSWSARGANKNGRYYYDIKLDKTDLITGVVTQGRKDRWQFIKKIKVSYFYNDKNEKPIGTFKLTAPRQTMKDRDELEYTLFKEPVQANIIRIRPLDWWVHPSFRIGLLINKNNIKNYETGTLKETNLLGISRPPRDNHIPLRYGERVYIYNEHPSDVRYNKSKKNILDRKNTKKYYLYDDARRPARFDVRRHGNASIMKLIKGNWKRNGRHGGGVIKYGDLIFIESQSTKKILQNDANGRFHNKNLRRWEKIFIENGPGSKGKRGSPIYSEDIIYLRTYKYWSRSPYRLQNAYNKKNISYYQNYNKGSWERMVIKLA